MENLSHILAKAKTQFGQQLPFVLYAKPHQEMLAAFFQKDHSLYFAQDFTETGFVFAPFEGKDYVLIPENRSEVLSVGFTANESRSPLIQPEEMNGKAAFEALVGNGIAAIREGKFEKLVLSRKEIVALGDFDLAQLFKKLLDSYPTAFRYCWFHPEIGLWLGATPEKLLEANGAKFHTMALAGTQQFQSSTEVDWAEKEQAEQEFVTGYIVESLEKSVSNLTVSKPYTAKAGNLLHIRTDIEGTLNSGSNLKHIVEILHPTPAVCGLPKLEAKKFVLENEGYDREFYSGFLGELNLGDKGKPSADLYVNLRCMQIKNNNAHLYMGCGITSGSDPGKEYIETVNKSMTMKKIIWKN